MNGMWYNNYYNKMAKAFKFELDEDGRVVVRINITDAEELLSVYNDHGKQIISHSTAQFINNVTKPIPNKQDIHLKIRI